MYASLASTCAYLITVVLHTFHFVVFGWAERRQWAATVAEQMENELSCVGFYKVATHTHTHMASFVVGSVWFVVIRYINIDMIYVNMCKQLLLHGGNDCWKRYGYKCGSCFCYYYTQQSISIYAHIIYIFIWMCMHILKASLLCSHLFVRQVLLLMNTPLQGYASMKTTQSTDSCFIREFGSSSLVSLWIRALWIFGLRSC